MIPLFILFSLVLCGNGLLQNDWAALEKVMRSRQVSARDDYEPPEVIAGVGFIGCFKDSVDRAIPFTAAQSSYQMTVKKCYEICSSTGKRYFALQAGTWCFCGDANDAYDKHGVATGCNKACAGNPNEVCGGAYRNSVYKIRSNNGYLGCFADKKSRAMTDGLDSDQVSVKFCYERCRSSGKRYFALQAPQWCFCGDANADYDQYGVATDACTAGTFTCPSDSTDQCGGIWASAVYAIRSDDGYIGCYKDRGDRAMPDTEAFTSNQMTVKKCYDSCSLRKKRYYALQASTWCFCGDTSDAFGKYGFGTGCSLACAGNSKQICGGLWYNSVYEIPL